MEKDDFFSQASISAVKPEEAFQYFLSHAYHDMPFFLSSLTKYNSSSYIYIGDLQNDLFYISDNMRDAFGFENNLVKNFISQWMKRIHGPMWREIFSRDRELIISEKKSIHDLRYQVEDKYGKVFWIRCCGSIQWSEDKTKALFFSGRISRQDESFTVDRVTNFPSEDTLQRHLIERQRIGQSFWTVGFCLNNIFQINASHGRTVADSLIHYISEELMDTLAHKMTFYRLPGVRCIALADEDLDGSQYTMMEEIRTIVESGYRKFGIQVAYPCSFAVMHFPTKDMSAAEFQENMVTLIKMARHNPQIPFMDDSERNLRAVSDVSSMEMTLTSNVMSHMENFRAVIQPVVSARSGRIIAGETLMRWKYQGKDVSPGVFIPMLEKNGMIHLAGRWVFEEAVKACKHIVTIVPDFYLTVNLSLQQLYDEGLAEFIPQVLEKYQLDGRFLVLEMTESCMDKEPALLLRLVNACKALGIRLALDDFGTGYSSIRVLMKYPTDIIKLDRSLLLEMTKSVDKSNFITSIVFACHQFGKKVCMEGVEDHQQRKLVQEAACDMIQGFYYYKPTELHDVFTLVKESNS